MSAPSKRHRHRLSQKAREGPDPGKFLCMAVHSAEEAFASCLTENKGVLTAQALPVHRRAFAGSRPLQLSVQTAAAAGILLY